MAAFRKFVFALGASVATVAVPALAQPLAMAQAQAPFAREEVTLAQGWHFHFGDAPTDPAQPGFDDATWEQVSVPHSWNRIGSYDRSRKSDNRQGVGWYRLTYQAPAAAKGRRFVLDFAAVSKIADVWVNGVHLGQHRGAFGRFRFDATAAWKPGQANLIVVKADNTKPTAGSPTGETIPLSGDFFVHGGIYRPVTLITTGEAGFDLFDHGGPGIYATTPQVASDRAEVSLLARLRNSGKATRRFQLTTVIRDAAGREVARSVQPVSLKPGAAEVKAGLVVPTPHLWNGTADPYLYSIAAELSDRGGVVDRVVQPLGIRTLRFDAEKGFFLNGVHVKLHGVSQHQDRPDEGWALKPEDHAQDMAMIREMGANTIRMAHYEHDDRWVDLADRAGMIAWAELPYVNGPSLVSGEGSPELWANAEEQLRELIRQDWNHPAVAMWSVGNEVDASNAFGVTKTAPNPLPLLQHLNAIAKAEDPSRPTTFADCCEDRGMSTGGQKLAGTADLIGYNRYFGWYYGKPADAKRMLGEQLDKLHAKHPGLPLSVSEYGAGGAITQHSDDISSGFFNFIGRPQPEEMESYVHEQNWPAIASRDFVFASWAWNMFDFGSDLRGEGDSVDFNTKGIVTADRKVRKDVFYYYQAQWSPKPMIYLTGRRYAERAYPTMTVKAYSNAPKAALSMNGVALGEVNCPGGICLWPNVRLAPGANRAVVTATKDGAAVQDEVTWAGPDPQQGLFVEAGDMAGHVVAGKRFGSDTFVTGGVPMVLNMGGFGGRTMGPPRKVEAINPELYDYWREGEAFSYALPLPDGVWKVTIHTFEPRPTTPADLRMSVSANGKVVLKPFSVVGEAGGPLKGLAKSFPVRVKGGVLKLDFAGTGGKAVVAAIEVSR